MKENKKSNLSWQFKKTEQKEGGKLGNDVAEMGLRETERERGREGKKALHKTFARSLCSTYVYSVCRSSKQEKLTLHMCVYTYTHTSMEESSRRCSSTCANVCEHMCDSIEQHHFHWHIFFLDFAYSFVYSYSSRLYIRN